MVLSDDTRVQVSLGTGSHSLGSLSSTSPGPSPRPRPRALIESRCDDLCQLGTTRLMALLFHIRGLVSGTMYLKRGCLFSGLCFQTEKLPNLFFQPVFSKDLDNRKDSRCTLRRPAPARCLPAPGRHAAQQLHLHTSHSQPHPAAMTLYTHWPRLQYYSNASGSSTGLYQTRDTVHSCLTEAVCQISFKFIDKILTHTKICFLIFLQPQYLQSRCRLVVSHL